MWYEKPQPLFSLRLLQASFGWTTVFTTLKEAYPWPFSVLCCCHLDSFAEVCQYIKIIAIFNQAHSKWTSQACLIATVLHSFLKVH